MATLPPFPALRTGIVPQELTHKEHRTIIDFPPRGVATVFPTAKVEPTSNERGSVWVRNSQPRNANPKGRQAGKSPESFDKKNDARELR